MTGKFKDKLREKILLYRLTTKRDPDAFAELYDAYVQRIYRFVFFKVGSREEAEDLTSEVFLKAWGYVNDGKEVKSFSGLLYRVARNCIIDLYRNRATHPEVSLGEDDDVSDKNKWSERVGATVASQEVVKILKKLKQEYQEVITLRYVDELEIDEIAEIINKSNLTVRVTLHRALKKLKEMIGE